MGISIDLYVSHNITQEEWKPVYEESLKLAEKFCLMDIELTEVYGEKLYCGVPTCEKMVENGIGWNAVGDYRTMNRVESFSLPKDILAWAEDLILLRKCLMESNNLSEEQIFEPLLNMPEVYSRLGVKDKRRGNCYSLWGGKTQGEPYHIYLLAIACMIEERLEGKAAVAGDITIGQCRKAVRLVNEVLDKPIRLPARCDLERLYQRVRNLPLKTEEVLNVFNNLYMGEKDKNYGDFVREHFSKEEYNYAWKHEFKGKKIGTFGFDLTAKEYFNMHNSLEELCDFVEFVDKDGQEHYERFVEKIMGMNMFLEEKDLRDCLEIQKESEATYSINTLAAQFAFAGAHNKSVNYYMPLVKIQEVLVERLGKFCNVEKIIKDYIDMQKEEKSPSTRLNDLLDTAVGEYKKDTAEYDICNVHDLMFYKKGEHISPKLEKNSLSYLKFYEGLCTEEKFVELINGTHEERCSFLIFQNKYLLLMKTCWFEIFEKIKKNPGSFRRYYPMVRVQVNDSTKWLVYAYVTNEDFYRYFQEKLALDEEIS